MYDDYNKTELINEVDDFRRLADARMMEINRLRGVVRELEDELSETKRKADERGCALKNLFNTALDTLNDDDKKEYFSLIEEWESEQQE